MVEKGMACVKYLLFFFNLIFFLFGIALMGVGIYAQIKLASYSNFSDANLSAPVILIIIVGVITLIVGFFGCCGACKENRCMVLTFAVLIGFILVLEIGAGIAGFVLKGDVQTLFEKGLNETVQKYYDDKDSAKAVDGLQNELKCCGVVDYKDYTKDKLPDSCCHSDSIKSCTKATIPPKTQGCLEALEKEFTKNIGAVAGVGIGLAVVELIGIILACCLASAIKNEYEMA